MSRDQRPGKLRVAGGTPAVPARRVDDATLVAEADGEAGALAASAGGSDPAHGAARSGGRLLPAMTFLLACGAAGIWATLLLRATA